ncbi:MAG: mechanosensitive ion channel domain-containing protein [Pseudomonadota bacterium]
MRLRLLLGLTLALCLNGAFASETRPAVSCEATPEGCPMEALSASLDAALLPFAEGSGASEAERQQARELQAQAQRALEAESRFKAGAERLRQALDAIPARLAALEAENASLAEPTVGAPDLDKIDTLDEAALRQRVVDARLALSARESALLTLLDTAQGLQTREATVRQRRNDVTRALSDRMGGIPARAESPALVELRRLANQLVLRELNAEKAQLDLERIALPLQRQQATLEISVARARIAQAKAQLRLLENRLEQVMTLRATAGEIPEPDSTLQPLIARLPSIEALQGEVKTLARRALELREALSQAQRRREEIESEARHTEEQLTELRTRLQAYADSPALLQSLAVQYDALLAQGQARHRAREERSLVDELTVEHLRLVESELGPEQTHALQERLRAELARIDPAPLDALRIEALAREWFTARQKLVQGNRETIEQLIRALGETRLARQQIGERLDALRSTLSENLFWTPSMRPMYEVPLESYVAGAHWLLRPAHLYALHDALWAGAAEQRLLYFLVMMLALGLWAARPRLRRLGASGALHIGSPLLDRFIPTLRALFVVLLLALPVPLILMALGLGFSEDSSGFVRGVGIALLQLAPMLYSIALLRAMAEPGGLAERHFGAPIGMLAALRLALGRLWGLLAITGFFASALGAGLADPYLETWARLSFVLACLAVLYFLWESLRSPSGATQAFLDAHPGHVLRLWRLPLFLVGLAGTLVAIVLAVQGYLYAASQLGTRLLDSLGLVFALLILQVFLMRWFALQRRRLESVPALEPTPVEDIEARRALADAAYHELEMLDDRARGGVRLFVRGLLLLGLYLIWSPVLPAVQWMEAVTLWHTVETVDGQALEVRVTLGKVLVALLLFALTFVVARNLPGLLAMGLRDIMPREKGARYALFTLVQYAVVVLGVLVSFDHLGLRWQNLQWLVAALGVGLGFGLQEIFGNFVSGLILLFERPVRVGDIVTVGGNLTGRITRIHIRATTIQDWDNKEIVVPNKQLITDRVVNWSLSSPVTRLVLPVGVAYGSDIDRVQELLTDVARANPRVMAEPVPFAFFSGFGDSALQFELRLFTREIDSRISLTHELNKAIYEALGAAGIGIPFPQRDVHIRSDERPANMAGLKSLRSTDADKDPPSP